jgi:hypothetical protein
MLKNFPKFLGFILQGDGLRIINGSTLTVGDAMVGVKFEEAPEHVK